MNNLEHTGPANKPQPYFRELFGPKSGGSADAPWAFLQMFGEGKLGKDDFWEILAGNWPLFDRIPHNLFQEAMQIARPFWKPWLLDGRPDGSLTIYRGQDRDAGQGLSWTLSPAVAECFAHGHRRILNPNPVVLERHVDIENVAMFLNDRNEAEVVLFAVLP